MMDAAPLLCLERRLGCVRSCRAEKLCGTAALGCVRSCRAGILMPVTLGRAVSPVPSVSRDNRARIVVRPAQPAVAVGRPVHPVRPPPSCLLSTALCPSVLRHLPIKYDRSWVGWLPFMWHSRPRLWWRRARRRLTPTGRVPTSRSSFPPSEVTPL